MCAHGGMISPTWEYKSDRETVTEVVEEFEDEKMVRRTTTTTVKHKPVDTPTYPGTYGPNPLISHKDFVP